MPCWWGHIKAETAFHGCHCPGEMAVRMPKVLARPWVGVRVFAFFYCRLTLNLSTHRSALARSTFSAHVVLELPCSSQPTASTCVVWSWRLKVCSVPASAVKGRPHRALSPTSARRLCLAPARVKWLCACVRYWPDRGLVFECVIFFYCRLSG